MKGCVLMPYLSFSQRMGIKPIEVPIQTDCLNEDTRMDIWNRFYQWFSSCVSDSGYMINLGMNKKNFCIRIWSQYMRHDLSQLYTCQQIVDSAKKIILLQKTAGTIF